MTWSKSEMAGETQAEKEFKWKPISLHKNLISKLDKDFLKKHGYRNIGEFVSEATRLRIEELTKE